MNDAGFMGRLKRLADLDCNVEGALEIDCLFPYQLAQSLSFDVFHGQVIATFNFAELVYVGDVGMGNSRSGEGLLSKA
jgi:hypothetical protein